MSYPSECVEVIDYIRLHVAKPDSLPGFDTRQWNVMTLRWPVDGIREGFCPVGLCPGNHSEAPRAEDATESLGLPEHELAIFIDWWDRQTDAVAAVEAVWGEAK